MGPAVRRSHLNSDVPSFSAVYILNFEPISLRALCVEEPQLGCIGFALALVGHVWKNNDDINMTVLRKTFGKII